MSEWISVDDRLPERNAEVLVVTPVVGGTKAVIAVLESDGTWHDTDSENSFWAINVTHWQPLPAPPEEA